MKKDSPIAYSCLGSLKKGRPSGLPLISHSMITAAVAAEPVPGRCCGGEQLQAADFDEGQPSCGFRGSLKGPSGRLKIVQSEACLLV